jgi:dsRNA-specific ribonuclease
MQDSSLIEDCLLGLPYPRGYVSSLEDFEARVFTPLSISFARKDLLLQCFINRSFLDRHRDSSRKRDFDGLTYKRLEFVGDSLLHFFATSFVFQSVSTSALEGIVASPSLESF